MTPPLPKSTLFPYTTLFRSVRECLEAVRSRHGLDLLNLHSQLLQAFEQPLFQPLPVPATVRRRLNRLLIDRSEEHTSELQSRFDLVCRLLLEKKKNGSIHCYAHWNLTHLSSTLLPRIA